MKLHPKLKTNLLLFNLRVWKTSFAYEPPPGGFFLLQISLSNLHLYKFENFFSGRLYTLGKFFVPCRHIRKGRNVFSWYALDLASCNDVAK